MAEEKIETEKVISALNDVKALDPKEKSKLQAMMGNGKQQAAKYCINQKGIKETLDESTVKPQATVFFLRTVKIVNMC